MSLNRGFKAWWVRVALVVMVVVGMASPMAATAATAQPRDNDANAIMWGGAYAKADWLNEVAHGDGHNSAANLQQIYYNEGRGITADSFASAATVDGEVTKDGRVVVGGQTVATGALSVGRSFMPGSQKSGSVWERPTSVSFVASSIPAFVNMDGGVFHYAVIKSCGNPVRASPVPAATPAPAVTQPSSFACGGLNPTQPDAATEPAKFRFTVTPQVRNVQIQGYHFVLSDGSAADTDANTPFIDHTFTPGTWKVDAQVKTSAGITPVSDACSVTVIVNQSTPTPTPTPTGQVLGATLPTTGPETALGGAAGLTALAVAGRAYARSRRSLLDRLRGRQDGQ